MSVFSLDPKGGNPVTTEVLDGVCEELGVTVKDDEKEAYRRLLAVFHDSAAELMDMPDYIPQTHVERFPRENVYFPDAAENTHGAWAWKCSIKDKTGASADGLLAGKTVALKDMIAVKDVPMLMGTDFIKGFVPDMDATVVTRMLEAGAHITGKATCENLCHSATSHSASTGPVENPFAKGYSSGGSSSGSGVLVALGEVDMSIGADQGGSVRIPACNCGIVGLKPTFGLIPYTGCGSNEPTNDHLGPMTRTVYDNALLLSAIAGTDNIDDRSAGAPTRATLPNYAAALSALPSRTDLTGLKIGIIAESLTTPSLDPRVKACFLNAGSQLTRLGAAVSHVSIPLHTKGPAIWTGVSKVGGYLAKTSGSFGRRGHQMVSLNRAFYPAHIPQSSWDAAYVSTKNIYLNGAYATTAFPQLLAKATNLSRQLRDAYDYALETYDVLITPTLPFVATKHAEAGAAPLELIGGQVGLTGNTCPFNQTGHPALTVPCGMVEAEEGVKLPVGLQVVGRWWGEETVYRVAWAWEGSGEWREL